MDDGQLDVGPAVINPRVVRRLFEWGAMRRLAAVDGDQREYDERWWAALAVPVAEARADWGQVK